MRALVRVEMPLVHVLQRMETVGIAVDPTSLAKHKVCRTSRTRHATLACINAVLLHIFSSSWGFC